jgi:hypothetical protein
MATTAVSQPVSTAEVQKAQAQLTRMRRSLATWLKHRKMNDDVVAGIRPSKKWPQAVAVQYASQRDWAIEQKLADQLHALLSEVMPNAALPDPNVSTNNAAAVQLAQIAISGQAPAAQAAPMAQGSTPPWLWPVAIVGGLLLAVTTAISSYADVAKSKEEYNCIQAGACTDYGFWLKAAAVAGLGWFLWTQTGLKDTVRGIGRREGSR